MQLQIPSSDGTNQYVSYDGGQNWVLSTRAQSTFHGPTDNFVGLWVGTVALLCATLVIVLAIKWYTEREKLRETTKQMAVEYDNNQELESIEREHTENMARIETGIELAQANVKLDLTKKALASFLDLT